MAVGDKTSVVIHADDLGASHGANAAYAELAKRGVCTSGSVMVPCPWFLEVAAMAQADPSLDLGVHLTLTSEMPHYKWRPLTSPPPSAGMTDRYGYFLANVSDLRSTAHPDAVEAELRAQIDMALASGIDVTHFDDHAGAVLAPEFCDIYIRLGVEYRLPILMTPSLSTYGGIHNLPGVDDEVYRRHAADARARGFRMFDRILETPWRPTQPPGETYRAMINETVPGLNFLAMHFTRPGDIEAIDPGTHHIRTGEYELFRTVEFAAWVGGQGLDLIGMRGLRDELRSLLPGGLDGNEFAPCAVDVDHLQRRNNPSESNISKRRPFDMMNSRFKKLSGTHTGHSYVVTGPASEIETPMRWNLQCEKEIDDKLVVAEDELADGKRWQPL